MTYSQKTEFGALRSCLWPIHRHELAKLLPMAMMICLIVFVYDVVRNMKDAVIITAAGAEVIPFIKVWALLPGAILLTLIFALLSNRFSQESVFYIMITSFLAFFAFFAFVMYPTKDSLHAHNLADSLQVIAPAGFKGLVAMCRYWSFVLFYVMAELWGSLILGVLFWGFANEVTRVGEARRFYSVFCIGANCAAIFAGQVTSILPSTETNLLPVVKDDWHVSLNILTGVIIACGILAMIIFRWMNKNVLSHPEFADLHETKKQYKAKKKLSLKESFSFLSNSKYLIYIAILVVSYNIVLNLVEVIWKDQLRRQYPSTDEYFAYMSNLTTMIGVISASTSLFMARIIEKFGWTRTSLITPVLMLITSAGFFSFMFFQNYFGSETAIMGLSPLAISVFFGGAQICLSKAMKYSVFDSTKEIAFIPLAHELKLRGKAAIDGVGSRMGKSGGSLIHTILLMFFGSLTASAPYVAAILTLVIGLWIYATRLLGIQFEALTSSELTSSSEKRMIEKESTTETVQAIS
jgi:AAA family ATP:ADP antiporter